MQQLTRCGVVPRVHGKHCRLALLHGTFGQWRSFWPISRTRHRFAYRNPTCIDNIL